jgi:lysozyme
MQLSEKGLDLIKHFEGYHKRLPDGSCAAYLDTLAKPHVWTVGYGLTEGVHAGMVLTEQEASDRFAKELSGHEAAVIRLVTVPISQHQFDALVSFSYNCGSGALSRSTLLRKLNRGDYDGASREFRRWNKAGGKVWPGLVRRRAAEAAMFLEPDEASPEPDMPQAVEQEQAKPSRSIVATGAAATAAGGATLIPPVPASITQSAEGVTAWQGVGETFSAFVGWGASNPLTLGAIFMVCAALWIIPIYSENRK